MMNTRLYRSRQDKIIAGVCGGLGSYFGIDSIIPRLLFIVLILGNGVGVLIYLIMAVAVPMEGGDISAVKATDFSTAVNNRRFLIGLLILFVGLVFLLQNFWPWLSWFFQWRVLFPFLLILLGLGLIIKRIK
jgi:phage shock protein C